MKFNLFGAALATAVTLASAICSADTFPDAYIRGSVGASKLPTMNYSTTVGGAAAGASITSKEGYDVGVAFGAQFDNGWRAEGAYDYSHNNAKTMTVVNMMGSGSSSTPGLGATKATTYMLNGLYDFDYQAVSLTPYVGLGLGVASMIHDIQFDGGSGTNIEMCLPAITFAGQGIVGVSYGWSDQVKLSLDYRYLQTAKNKLPSALGTTSGITANHYAVHRISVGLTTHI